MMFLKTAVLFGLVASICATPLPKSENGVTGVDFEIDDPEFSIDEKREAAVETPNYSILEARAAFKDTKCPDNKKTYKAADIKRAVETENRKNNPDKYGNREGGKKLFNTDKQLYKARLDNVARAVFSRGKDNKYEYRGLIEHDKGTGNGFHLCK